MLIANIYAIFSRMEIFGEVCVCVRVKYSGHGLGVAGLIRSSGQVILPAVAVVAFKVSFPLPSHRLVGTHEKVFILHLHL